MKNITNHDLKRITELAISWGVPMVLLSAEAGTHACVPAEKETEYRERGYTLVDKKDVCNYTVEQVDWHGELNTLRTMRGKLKKMNDLSRVAVSLDENSNRLWFVAR